MAAVAVCAGAVGCGEESHKDAEKEAHGDEGLVVFHDEQAKMMGVKTSRVVSGEFRQVLEVGGEVLPARSSQSVVSAKSAGIVRFAQGMAVGAPIAKNAVVCSISSAGLAGGDPRSASRIVYESAKKEFERVKELYDANLAGAKDYRDAQRALALAENAVEGDRASGVAVSPLGGVVSGLLVENGAYVEAGAPVAIVSESNRLVLRAAVPQEFYASYPLFDSANFKLPYGDTVFELGKMSGKRISASSAAPVEKGYFNLEFEFVNDGQVASGSYATVYLLGAKREHVISVPLSAIVEEQGAHFVFVAVVPEHYEKRPVTLGDTDGSRVEIRSGLKPGESIVSEGAVYLKLAANTGAVPEGHHHH